MHKGISLLLVLFAICMAVPAPLTAAPELYGAQYFQYGLNARQFSLSGLSAGRPGRAGDSFLNPAAVALNEQWIGSLSLLPGRDTLYSASLSFPFPRGVLAFNGVFSSMPEDFANTSGRTVFAGGNFAKQISPHFLFGVGLNLAASSLSDAGPFTMTLGLNAGAVFMETGIERGQSIRRKNQGWAIQDFTFGVSLINLKLRDAFSVEGFRHFPEQSLKSGASAIIYNNDWQNLRLNAGFTLPLRDIQLRFTTGLEWELFRHFYLRGSTVLGPSAGAHWGLGTGFSTTFEDGTSFSLDYALQRPEYAGSLQTSHFVSLSFALGTTQFTTPEVSLETVTNYFSPNGDGIQDELEFEFDIDDYRVLGGWKIIIRSAEGKTVRSLYSNEPEDGDLDLAGFFHRLIARREKVSFPDEWVWTGLDNDDGNLEDGTYICQASAWDIRDNRGFSREVTIHLKSRPPKVRLAATNLILSPDDDGRREQIIIAQIASNQQGPSSWTGTVLDSSGNIVRNWRWNSLPPAELPWKGRDKSGKPAPDGTYRYSLRGRDAAGNSCQAVLSNIIVSTKNRHIAIKKSAKSFSPNSDRYRDSLRFTSNIPDENMLQYWKISILDSKNRAVLERVGSNSQPVQFWNGKNARGEAVPDGKYRIRLETFYKDGNQPRHTSGAFILDTTPPKTIFSAEPGGFTPDDDSYQDTLALRIRFRDTLPVSRWEVRFYQNEKLFHVKKGRYPRSSSFSIKWDGKNRKGQTLDSESTFSMVLSMEDEVGNKSTSDPLSMQTGILAQKVYKGRIIHLPGLFSGPFLRLREKQRFQRLAKHVRRFRTHNVLLFIGGLSSAQKKQAFLQSRNTRDALIRMGIAKNRLVSRGVPKTEEEQRICRGKKGLIVWLYE